MRFEVAVAEYMEDRARRLRRTTLEGYESAVRCHLAPRWAGRELEGIGFEELQAWVEGFERPGAAEKAFKTFRQVYRWALERLRAIRGDRRRGRTCGLSPNAVSARFRRFCAARGLPWVPVTCLRHSWATIALEAGSAIEDVSVALGHSTVNTCIQHYLQSFRQVVSRAGDCYSRALLGS